MPKFKLKLPFNYYALQCAHLSALRVKLRKPRNPFWRKAVVFGLRQAQAPELSVQHLPGR